MSRQRGIPRSAISGIRLFRRCAPLLHPNGLGQSRGLSTVAQQTVRLPKVFWDDLAVWRASRDSCIRWCVVVL